MTIDLKNKFILITGGTGFIGHEFIKELTKLDAKLIILTRQQNPAPLKEVQFITYSNESLSNLLTDISYDYVFHFAAKVSYTHNSNEIDQYIESNITLGTKILEDIKVKKAKTTFVNISTYWENSSGSPKRDPFNFYAATKLSFQEILKFYSSEYLINTLTLKLFDVYGENDTRNKLLNLILKNQKLEVTSGEQFIDFVHISDVISAIIVSINFANTKSPKYSVTSGRPIKLKKVFDFFNSHSSKVFELKIGSKDEPKKVVTPFYEDQLPNWIPKVNLFTKLEELISDSNK